MPTSLSPVGRISRYIPTNESLQSESIPLIKSKINILLPLVEAKWLSITSNIILMKVSKARIVSTERKLNGIKPLFSTLTGIKELHERIAFDLAGHIAGYNLIKKIKTVDQLSLTKAEAIKTLLQLKRFDDTLIVLLAAYKVSLDTSIPIYDVLALYRIEGFLQVPTSNDVIIKGIPSGVEDCVYELGYEGATSIPDFKNCIWVGDATYNDFFRLGIKKTDVEIKHLILQDIFMIIGGLDIFGNMDRIGIELWSKKNWNEPNITKAVNRYAKAFNNFNIMLKVDGPNSVYIGTPINSEEMVISIMSEAVKYYYYLKENLSDLDIKLITSKLSAGVGYIRYNILRTEMKYVIV